MSEYMNLVRVTGVLEMRIVPERYSPNEYADNQEAMAKLQQLMPRATENTAENIDKKAQLASLYLESGCHDQAAIFLAEALDARRSLWGWGYPKTIQTQELLACAFYAQGRIEDAMEQFEAAGRIIVQSLGTEHVLAIQNMFNRGVVMWQLGKCGGACDTLHQAYKISKRIHGLHHRWTLSTMENLAFMYHFTERPWEAQKIQQQVVDVRLQVSPCDDSSLLKSAVLLGKIYMDMEWWKETEATYRIIVELREKLQGTESPAVLASKANLVTALQKQGRLDQAEKLSIEVLNASNVTLGPESPVTMRNQLRLATILGDRGEYTKALKIQQEVLETQEKLFEDFNDEIRHTLSDISVTFMKLNRYDEAVTVCQRVISALDQHLGMYNPASLSTRIDLAYMFSQIDRLDEAESTVLGVLNNYGQVQDDSELLSKLREVINTLLQYGRTATFNKFYFDL
ncbi:hypothetical protein BDV26DRAFT_50218 [Aspergillus bertholletiae]|uniref:Uncharacterized protein n=1 Tax=Aspergillus bertholletiae TaxID=1226010 RepID=A0A5N7AXT8_9EURO|nr:hypothetical protein BDV26DRAFT_50218 [Aspergillus bertholletiae]